MSYSDLATVGSLIRILDKYPGKESISKILDAITFGEKDLKPFCTWDKSKYTRNCLCKREGVYELILMCWEKGQQTLIHDHGSQEGWVYVISGEITEERYSKKSKVMPLEKIKHSICKAGSHTYISDNIGLHRLMNTNSGRSITLHLYTKPISTCSIYDELSGQKEEIELKYDSIQKVLINNIAS